VLFRRFRTHKTRARLDDFLAISVDELRGSPSQIIASRQERQLLLQGLRGIPVDHQICLELHYWENMGVADIAEVLGVAPGTVKSRLHRAREQLRKRIGEIEADPALKDSTIDSLDAHAVALKDDVDSGREDET
jgi:RNA polymerase sigma factor (sigma-70 family)